MFLSHFPSFFNACSANCRFSIKLEMVLIIYLSVLFTASHLLFDYASSNCALKLYHFFSGFDGLFVRLFRKLSSSLMNV